MSDFHFPRRTLLRLVVIGLLVLPLFRSVHAQNARPDPNAEPPEPAVLSGTVLSSAGEPLNNATVLLLPSTFLSTGPVPASITRMNIAGVLTGTTNQEGAFRMEAAPGQYQLIALANGYLGQRYGARSPTGQGTVMKLNPGTTLRNLELIVSLQAVVTGTVKDPYGDAVEGAMVQVEQISYSQGTRQLRPFGGASTDDRGQFRVSGLAPGRYIISAAPRPTFLASSVAADLEEVPIQTFYPNVTDRDVATPVIVNGGQDVVVNLQMALSPVTTVSGVVRDQETGNPVPGASVLWLDDLDRITPMNLKRVTADENGAFRVNNLSPGNYRFAATNATSVMFNLANGGSLGIGLAPGSGVASREHALNGQTVITLGKDPVEDLAILVEPGATLTGRVRVEDGEYADAERVLDPLFPVPPPLSFQFRPVEGMAINLGRATVADDGTFQMDGIPPGNYLLDLPATWENHYLKSILFNGQDVTHSTITVTEAGGVLELLLADGGADVSGSVINKDGEPQPGIQVSVWPRRLQTARTRSGIQTMGTDQNGQFSFKTLPPGDYYAIAWEELPDPGLASYPDFLARFKGVAEELKLEPGGTASPQLEPVSADRAARVMAELP